MNPPHPICPPGAYRVEKVIERMDLWTNEGDDTDGASERWRQRQSREQCSKKDDNVDKVKLEIKPTDGGAKNVTCQVRCGTPGTDRRIHIVGR